MPFLDSLDVANRACDHLGVNQILSITEDSDRNNVLTGIYDKVRRAELRRNSWRFAIRKTVLRPIDTTTLEIVPGVYSSTQTYLQGEMVQDNNNLIWISKISDNLNNTPGGNNETWDMYFGPMTADLWSSTTTYYPGELVYLITGTSPQGYQLFMCLLQGVTTTPNVAEAWSATVQYFQDQIVSHTGSNWRSLLPVNLNNAPAVPPLSWVATTAYVATNKVTGPDNFIYTAAGNTTGNNPVTDGGVHWTNTNTLAAWTNSPTLPNQDLYWRSLTCTLKNLLFVYPIGSGPSSQAASQNIFRLPAGYVGPAPQNPKQGVMTFLGGPSGNNEPDWELESNFIVSSWAFPIVYRFVADITKVREMDDMFCEGLACRMAGMGCKRITGSDTLVQLVSGMYKTFMGEARLKNAIETGTQEPYEDSYVTVRI